MFFGTSSRRRFVGCQSGWSFFYFHSFSGAEMPTSGMRENPKVVEISATNPDCDFYFNVCRVSDWPRVDVDGRAVRVSFSLYIATAIDTPSN